MPWLKSFFSKQDDFSKALALSAIFHLFVIVFFIIKFLVFSKPLIDLSQAISVNISDLSTNNKLPEKYEAPAPIAKEEPAPEKEVKPAPPVAPPKKAEKLPVKVTPPPEKETINLSKVKSKQKQALDKIKQMSALDKIQQEVTEDTKRDKAAAKKAARSRMVSAGSPLTGLDKIEAAQYLQLLDARIKESWTLPQWLISKNLKAQVLVKFNTLGQIMTTKLLLSSGNSTYDNYCLQAITNAAPFPKAPDKFSEKFSVDGLIVGFPE